MAHLINFDGKDNYHRGTENTEGELEGNDMDRILVFYVVVISIVSSKANMNEILARNNCRLTADYY
jgi:hypothetical protein